MPLNSNALAKLLKVILGFQVHRDITARLAEESGYHKLNKNRVRNNHYHYHNGRQKALATGAMNRLA
jgi:hypothetical protein